MQRQAKEAVRVVVRDVRDATRSRTAPCAHTPVEIRNTSRRLKTRRRMDVSQGKERLRQE
jgi:hypothetical protein